MMMTCIFFFFNESFFFSKLFALFSAIYRVESGFDQAREMGLHLTALENGAASFPSAYLPLLLHFLLGACLVFFFLLVTLTL